MLLIVRYLGPTAHRGTRLRVSAHELPPRFYPRNFDLEFPQDAVRAALQYTADMARMDCDAFEGRYLGLIRYDEAVVETWCKLTPSVCPYCFRLHAPGTALHGRRADARPCDPCLDEAAEHLRLPEELDTRLKLDLDLIDG